MKYAVVISEGSSNYSLYVPDMPGCVAAADSFEDTKELIREAIALHLEGMREDGLPVPELQTSVTWIEV